jgi:hypothetical protein
MRRKIFCVAILMLLGGCEGKIEGGENVAANRQGEGEGTAEGKAEEGKIALKAPGFDLSINIPKDIAKSAKSDQDSALLYPGSTISGMYIAAGNGGDGNGEVELRFAAPRPPAEVAAWYRDPARADSFTIDEARRSGGELLLGGRSKGDKQAFKLRLQAGAAGGTDGRLTLRDRG